MNTIRKAQHLVGQSMWNERTAHVTWANFTVGKYPVNFFHFLITHPHHTL